MKRMALFDQKKVRAILDSLDFFEKFTDAEKRAFLARRNHFVAYEPGEALIAEGTREPSFFVLIWGAVNVIKGKRSKPLAKLEAGEFFGEVSFLTESPRTASVVADGKVLAIQIDRKMLEEVGVETREKIKDQIIRKLIQRLDRMNRTLAEIP